MTAPERLYPSNPECLVVLFDLRHPDGCAELHHLRATMAEHADVEALSDDVFALVIRPGWASEPAA